MKIVFSIDQTYLHGGIEKVLAEKVNYLVDKLGYDVSIITIHQAQKSDCYYMHASVKRYDLNIAYNRNISYFTKSNIKWLPKHYKALKHTLKMIKPDIWVVCNFGVDFFFNTRIARKLKIPIIKEFHGSEYKRLENKLLGEVSLLQKIQYTQEVRYDALVVLNPSEKVFFTSNNVVIIPNPLQLSDVRCDSASKKVLAAGRLAPVKRFDRLIEIWAEIHTDYPDWQLDIWGPNYLNTEEELSALINKYGLGNVVHLKGSVQDIQAVIQDYSIYAMTSETECFPMILLEAQSVGMPIVAYDVPTGPKSIVMHQQNGLLVTNDEKTAFVLALKSLMGDEARRKDFGEMGVKNSRNYAPEMVMKQWVELFEKLKTNKRS